MELRKIIELLKFQDLLIPRLALAIPLVFNLEAGSISNLIINHLPYILLLVLFPNLLKFFEIELNIDQIV